MARTSRAQSPASRLERLVGSLAMVLAQETARELAERSLPPRITLKVHPLAVLEGDTVTVEVEATYADEVTLLIPGEHHPRTSHDGDRVTYIGSVTGPVLARGRNALHPDVKEVASDSVHVMPIPKVNPYTFDAIHINGLRGSDVLALTTAFTLDRLQMLHLNAWELGRQAGELTPGQAADASAEIAQMGDLLTEFGRVTGQGWSLVDQHRAGAHRGRRIAREVAEDMPSLTSLRGNNRTNGTGAAAP